MRGKDRARDGVTERKPFSIKKVLNQPAGILLLPHGKRSRLLHNPLDSA